MALTFHLLGSGTLRPHEARGAPAHWLAREPLALLMDCGAGTLRTLARLGLSWGGVTHLIFSHLHTDHVGDLAPLLFALKHGLESPRQEPLTVLGPRGLRDHLSQLASAHGTYILEPGFPLRVEELKGGVSWTDPGGHFFLRTRGTRHTEHSLAFRVECPEGIVGYTGDTGPDPGLGDFLKGSDLLVAECSHPDGEVSDTHLTPGSLAELAGRAEPELLVSVHAYPPLDPEEVPDLLASAGYRGRALAGWDGMRVSLGPEGPVVSGSGSSAPPGPMGKRPGSSGGSGSSLAR